MTPTVPGRNPLAELSSTIGARDWAALEELIADGFLGRDTHSEEMFDREEFLAMTRRNPEGWDWVLQDVFTVGDQVIGSATVREEDGDGVWHLQRFAGVDGRGRITTLTDVWTGVQGAGARPRSA